MISSNVARPIRTGVQTGAAWVIVEFLDAFLFDMDERQYGALVAVLTIVISLVQNFAESQLGVALLRKLPAPKVELVEEENDRA